MEVLHLRESQDQLVKNITIGEYSYYTISLLNLINPELFFQDNLSYIIDYLAFVSIFLRNF